MMMKSLLLVFAFIFFVGCSEDDETTAATTSTEATAMAAASTNMATVASNSNGPLVGTTTTPGAASLVEAYGNPYDALKLTNVDVDTACTTSGVLDSTIYNESDALFPLYDIYCNLLKRPNGPDTARGAIDRVSGFLCAIGNVIPSSGSVAVSFNVTTDCFSSGFVTMVQEQLGTTSLNATVTGSTDVTGVAPSTFDQYVIINFEDTSLDDYTIASAFGTDTRSMAVYSGVPGDQTGTLALSVFMDRANGVMKVETRDLDNNRHVRFEMAGTLDTDYAITNVLTLHYLNADNTGTDSTSKFTSMSGTPSEGRRLRHDNFSGDLSHAGDDACYGETGVTCSGNTGIVVADAQESVYTMMDGSGYTNPATWFLNNSDLTSTGSLTVDPDADIWP